MCTQVHRGIPNFLQPAEASNQGHQALLSSKKGDLHQDLSVSTDGTDGFIDKIYIYNIYILYIIYTYILYILYIIINLGFFSWQLGSGGCL